MTFYYKRTCLDQYGQVICNERCDSYGEARDRWVPRGTAKMIIERWERLAIETVEPPKK